LKLIFCFAAKCIKPEGCVTLGSDTKETRKLEIAPEEVTKQRQYIDEIKHMNAQQEMQSGRKHYYSLKTFGCQMNENDSERLAGMLSGMGYNESDKLEDCDLIIFNTCCVRENAEFKVYGHLGDLKKLKEKNPGLIIAVCGSMMQQPEVVETIKKKYRQVSLIFGTHNLYKFPELLYKTAKYEKSIIAVEESQGNIAEGMPIERKDGIKAWVTIMYGCNNFCSYCIVPYVRGRERSRTAEDILDEIGLLGHQGYKEITLLGQNVNSFGKDKAFEEVDFPRLLRKINEIDFSL
jgi:tRNA-2-methylthio-N6-dimethylallyladenosine synthase